MTLVPKRAYALLLSGDVAVFVLALWTTLAARYLELPSWELFRLHLLPFSLLFVAWIGVFVIAGLYGRHTALFRHRLPSVIFLAQTVNVVIAALFFFFVPIFGIAPKTNLVLYLLFSSALVVLWRVALFPRLGRAPKLRGVLIASGADAEALADEVGRGHYPFVFSHAVDSKHAPSHEVIQAACRAAESDDVSFLVVDFSDKAIAASFPVMYDAAFHKRRFALVDAVELYQELFDRVPLSLVHYEWVLENVTSSRVYDALKRTLDLFGASLMGLISLVFYPFVYAAVKIDDGGPLFITQTRVGRFQRPIQIVKFRTMTGNDEGNYGRRGKTALKVTKVGAWLRMLRLDELPQLWNVLKGDLSLVGPRPELPALAAQYSARIPYYNARYLVSPGLSGWAQIRHDRHPHHGTDVAETKEKLSYDLYYLKHRSFLLDLLIMLQTIRILFAARGS